MTKKQAKETDLSCGIFLAVNSRKGTGTLLTELLSLPTCWLRLLGFEDLVFATVLTKHSPGMFSVQHSKRGRSSILGIAGLKPIFSLYDLNSA